MGSSRTLLPAGALAAAALLAACGHPAAGPARPAAAHAPAGSTTTPPGANRPLPHALSAPRATTAPATTAPPPAPAAPRVTTPPRTAAPPAPRTGPPKPPARTPAATVRPSRRATAPGTTVLHIGTWSRPVVRGDQAAIDRCTAAVLFTGPDPAQADGDAMRTTVIVGHDFCGYAVLAPLPVGTRVTLDTPRGTLSYHVYANYVTPGQGGPDNGLYWGDLTLQTCVGPDTGFSYLVRD